METYEIDQLIDRACRAYLRRPEFDGRAPVIEDSDVFLRGGVNVVELREGEETLAYYAIRPTGDLRFLPDGKL